MFLPYCDFQCKNIEPPKWTNRIPTLSLCCRTISMLFLVLLYNPRMKTKLEPEENSNNFFLSLPASTRKREQSLANSSKMKERNVEPVGFFVFDILLSLKIIFVGFVFAKSICENDFGFLRFRSKEGFCCQILTIMRIVFFFCGCFCCKMSCVVW